MAKVSGETGGWFSIFHEGPPRGIGGWARPLLAPHFSGPWYQTAHRIWNLVSEWQKYEWGKVCVLSVSCFLWHLKKHLYCYMYGVKLSGHPVEWRKMGGIVSDSNTLLTGHCMFCSPALYWTGIQTFLPTLRSKGGFMDISWRNFLFFFSGIMVCACMPLRACSCL